MSPRSPVERTAAGFPAPRCSPTGNPHRSHRVISGRLAQRPPGRELLVRIGHRAPARGQKSERKRESLHDARHTRGRREDTPARSRPAGPTQQSTRNAASFGLELVISESSTSGRITHQCWRGRGPRPVRSGATRSSMSARVNERIAVVRFRGCDRKYGRMYTSGGAAQYRRAGGRHGRIQASATSFQRVIDGD